MNELIQAIFDHVYNNGDLPEYKGDSATINLSDEFLEYWVEGKCIAHMTSREVEDGATWAEYRLSFTIDKLDVKDSDGEWHELPNVQAKELQTQLNKSI